jgi:hypothetical protein
MLLSGHWRQQDDHPFWVDSGIPAAQPRNSVYGALCRLTTAMTNFRTGSSIPVRLKAGTSGDGVGSGHCEKSLKNAFEPSPEIQASHREFPLTARRGALRNGPQSCPQRSLLERWEYVPVTQGGSSQSEMQPSAKAGKRMLAEGLVPD